MTSHALTRAEVADLAERVASLLADPDVALNPQTRARWEGAAAALAFVLGDLDRLPVDDPDRLVL